MTADDLRPAGHRRAGSPANLAGRLTDKLGGRLIAAGGFAIVAAATVPFAFAGAHTSAWLLALVLIIRGFGLGAVTIPVMAVAYTGLDEQQIAHSSVVTRTTQQIGGSFGTAVLAVILENAVAAHHGVPASAFDVAFWWSVGFSVIAVLLSLWLPGARRAPKACLSAGSREGDGEPRAQEPHGDLKPRSAHAQASNSASIRSSDGAHRWLRRVLGVGGMATAPQDRGRGGGRMLSRLSGRQAVPGVRPA